MFSIELVQASERRRGVGRPRRLTVNRLIDIEDGAVNFRWKDYRHGSRRKVMIRCFRPFPWQLT